jgi:peroxiredoxin Q/BCP
MRTITSLAAAMFLPVTAPAAEVRVGSSAPVFEAMDDTGKVWKSRDHVGKSPVVVYFYPADMTPGCTKQACAFRNDMAELTKRGITVVGVSGDSVRNHQLFKDMHKLNFSLLADEDGAVAKAFGVPTKNGGSVKKDVHGKLETLTRGVTASRWTFVIGKNGKILDKLTKVKAQEDSARILRLLK